MNNDDFDLDKIWQQQDVVKVDTQSLKRQWWLMRMKQYLYILMDALATIAVPIAFFFFPRKMSTFETIWIWSIFLFIFVWFFYLVWLRRFSLGFKSESATTSEFIERVKLQYRQNIKIAYVNKVLCYFTPLFFISYLLIAYFGDFVDQQELLRKAKLMLILNLVCMPLIWVWMHKRELKFKRLLVEFESQWTNH
ncbi:MULTISPECIES: hypothetical protein [Alteromonadaceae]|uniref:hypothetical protein n=1 Tax=Alteromonadaceae TaxID=72275 RepID=UPI001C09D865|nr:MULTISPECIES: hypothetical protein [Aliiglaciecola]MBU2877472.1 hypothetical protein [Aliiglaciecola lipolytica]MDO6711055.1 hypothetical protein [Aliiglaciecola sp. 2_MG-2023]MDO6751969.1 hypothetical protein [Aliiglaciecola sp. 1_MG-2023]